VNDAAFLTRADYVGMLGNVMHRWTQPNQWRRNWIAIAGGQQQYNYDGDRVAAQLHAYTGGQLANYWNVSVYTELYPEVNDDRLTRGGPVVRRPRGSLVSTRLSTDARKEVVFSTGHTYVSDVSGGWQYAGNLSVRFKPASNVQFSVGPSYAHSLSTTQFVLRQNDSSATHFSGQRAVFADISQNQPSVDTRLNWTFIPTLTLELFAQPFVFGGEYSRFKEFTAPRTTATKVYGRDFGTICFAPSSNRYTADPNGNCASAAGRSAQAFSFDNPDLNVRSLRGNAVLRWEYRPGSTLFLVWQQQREGIGFAGEFSLLRDTQAIFRQRPDNIFVIKASYWIGR